MFFPTSVTARLKILPIEWFATLTFFKGSKIFPNGKEDSVHKVRYYNWMFDIVNGRMFKSSERPRGVEAGTVEDSVAKEAFEFSEQ